MSPSRLFILRPVATTLLMAAILLTGLIAFRELPVSALPEVDYPTIQVVTFYPGASAEVMASAVTAPLERQFGQVPGLSQMTSTSSNGASIIVLRFLLELDIDVGEQEVQAAINAAQSYLPADLPTPPIYSKTNPADAPILTLALTSKTVPLSKIQDLADTRLAQKISQLPGVGLVSLSGGQKPAIRILANPTALSSLGLNLEDLRVSLQQASSILAKGSFDGPTQNYQIDANDQLLSSEDFKKVIVAYRNGAPVQLTDVAKVVDGVENLNQAAWMNETPAIILNIQRHPGANIIEVVDRIQKLLPQLQTTLPSAIQISTLTDRTTTIRASVKDVEEELLLTIGLVILVIFLFLRSVSATIIPSIAVPLSLIGTFGAMYLSGYSLNNLTLMSLTIATGFVVDDAIVMIENIMRFIEDGEEPMQAALKGAEQIGFTIISLTVSLIAVLIPLLFMSDVTGRLFRQFAVTLSVAILLSCLISLTLTPMMAARLLKKRSEKDEGRLYKITEKGWKIILDFYERTLNVVLKHQNLTLAVVVSTFLLTIALYLIIPKGFFPSQDTGLIQGISEASQSVSFAEMARLQQTLTQAVLSDSAVESVSSFIGIDGTNTILSSGRLQINLKPLASRDASAEEVIKRLQPRVAKVDGIKIYIQPVQDLTVEDQVTRTEYQISFSDPNAKELSQWMETFAAQLQKLPQLRDIATDEENDGLAINLTIDRTTASRLGLTPLAIDQALYDAFGQRQISTLYTQLNQYHLILEAQSEFQKTPFSLNNIYIRSGLLAGTASGGVGGGSVPLSAFTHFESGTAPLSIVHLGQFPAVTVSFNLSPSTSLGSATQAIEETLKKSQKPPGIQAAFQGAAAAFESSLKNEPLLILAAFICVYIVLGILYESFIHPITILSTLPSAGLGACIALLITGHELNVVSIIGIILLIGIVKKNGIMIVDFALEAQRKEHKNSVEAVTQASLLRFRPILMTTMAALLAGLPLALGQGIGSELRHPLGIAMVGGLLVSQVLTLYTTPVIYIFFDRLGAHKK
jgi:multidrug efflux pump